MEPRVLQQLAARGGPRRHVGPQAAQVGRGPVGRHHAHRGLRAARPEAGQHDGGVHAAQPGAELAAHGGGGHDQVAAQRGGVAAAERGQLRRREPVGLQQRAHLRVAGHDRVRGDLRGDPPGRGRAGRRGRPDGRRGGCPAGPGLGAAGPAVPGRAGLRVTAMVIAPAPKSTAATTSRVSTRQRVWRGQRTCRRRCAHSCTVVSSTFPHDGGGGGWRRPRPGPGRYAARRGGRRRRATTAGSGRAAAGGEEAGRGGARGPGVRFRALRRRQRHPPGRLRGARSPGPGGPA